MEKEPLAPTSKDPISQYEKEIFDLRQLLEISKSLNSTLDLNALLQAILYTCMAHVQVLRAAAFVRTEVHRADLQLHRNVVGYEISPGSYVIPEGSTLLQLLNEHYHCYTMEEIEDALPGTPESELLRTFTPTLLVPIRAQNLVNGLILLGERIPGEPVTYTEKERGFLLDVARLAGIAVHNAFLFEMTNTDLMTRLKMRHYFLTILGETMHRARSSGEPLSIAMLDLDNFKHLNDNYGHLFGDEVLQTVSALLLSKIRQTDLAARYGGEEFIILLPATAADKAVEVSERIRMGVEALQFSSKGEQITVTLSIGVVQFEPLRDESTDGIIERADRALYKAKGAGKNRTELMA